jgi:hypothetical protein
MSGCATPGPDTPSTLRDLFGSDDVTAAQADCLTERGWGVEVRDGAIVMEVPASQQSAYERDAASCAETTGYGRGEPLTAKNFDDVYAWYSEIAKCLDDAGFEVPPKPSRDVFEESYETDPWIPWDLATQQDPQRALALCPVIDPRNL